MQFCGLLVVVCVLWERFVVGNNKATHTTMRIWVAGGARILLVCMLGATHYCQVRAALRGPAGAWARQLFVYIKTANEHV